MAGEESVQRRIINFLSVLVVALYAVVPVWAAGDVTLEHVKTDVSNIGSLQRGARNFVNWLCIVLPAPF